MNAPEAPDFFLYGEPPRVAEAGFLHLEAIHVRSRPSGWAIRPHRHRDLNHLFLVTGGGGWMDAEEEQLAFQSPCLLLAPAGGRHGFDFRPESTGQVLTLATGFLAERPALAEARTRLFDRAHILDCQADAAVLQEAFAQLGRELAWRAPGHQAAVEACVFQALVLALRLQHRSRARLRGESDRDGALLARFREQVELSFRRPRRVEAYAQALGVSLSRLHQVCRRAGGLAPLELIQARRLVEAKRALLYSDMRIADLAFDLGFEDAAYFSRFFTRHVGISPRSYRQGGRSDAGEGGRAGEADPRVPPGPSLNWPDIAPAGDR